MGKNKFLIFSLILIFAIVGCQQSNTDLPIIDDSVIIEDDSSIIDDDASNLEDDIISDNDIVEEEPVFTYPEPDVSQQIDVFPWDEDEDFKQAQADNNAHVLIAGFVTVSYDYSDAELANINHATNFISQTVLLPGEVFSQNQTIGPYSLDNGYFRGEGYSGGQIVSMIAGGVCNVAGTVYNTAILSNLEIVERHYHSMPVPYLPYGQDATVYSDILDIKFRNNTDSPLLIWAELIDSRLYMAFYGQEKAPQVIWEHEQMSSTPASTEYLVNPELEDGEENILVEGIDGAVVRSKVKIIYDNGHIEERDLAISSYLPLNFLIEKNSLGRE